MSITVSVIIPTYNRAALLVQAIESVLHQAYRDYEIIVVDDGSTDDTEARVASYRGVLTYVRQPNQGVNAARNHGITLARGRYIALLDDDDLWLESKLDAQVRLLDRHAQAGFVFSDFFILEESGARRPHGVQTWHVSAPDWNQVYAQHYRECVTSSLTSVSTGFDVYQGDIYEPSLTAPYVLPSTALIRRRCIDPDLRLNESDPTCGDWEFFARLSRRHGAVFMDVETALNRSHEDAVRLTRLPRKLQLARRIGMLRRVWKSDTKFYRQRRSIVDQVERGLLRDLALTHAFDGEGREAREAFRERRSLYGKDGLPDILLAGLLWMPGGVLLLKAVREARHRLAKASAYSRR